MHLTKLYGPELQRENQDEISSCDRCHPDWRVIAVAISELLDTATPDAFIRVRTGRGRSDGMESCGETFRQAEEPSFQWVTAKRKGGEETWRRKKCADLQRVFLNLLDVELTDSLRIAARN